eukprot:scaffold4838_cov69-Phaeocystis_antarctica.AAC.1
MQTKCEPSAAQALAAAAQAPTAADAPAAAVTNCEHWGAPYVYGTEMLCQYGTTAASCDVTPIDCAHRRL